LDKFKELVNNRHEYAKNWKARTGGKILGYFEPYFPEEIAYAAGMLPVKVLAEHEPDVISAKWIYASCYPVKDIVNQILKGRYDYVDAIVNTEGCQWMFNAFEVAVNNKPDWMNHYLFLPDYPDSPTSKYVLLSELNVLKGKFEEWSGNTITDEALDNAIEIYNTNRRLLHRIYEMRRMFEPVILGSEAMNIILASQIMDKAEMNKILKAFVTELEDRKPYADRVRLMLIGSETFNSDLEELVESVGANIAVDELDNGTSYVWREIYPLKDRLMAIGLRYLGRPHCALKDDNWRRRPQHIFELYEDFCIDGALIAKQIYCHPHGSDNYAVWKLLRERNIPFHFFERDMSIPTDETRVRIEAFVNMLRPGLTRIRGWHTPLVI
jgi:benzoyl-CoA reductase subunit C